MAFLCTLLPFVSNTPVFAAKGKDCGSQYSRVLEKRTSAAASVIAPKESGTSARITERRGSVPQIHADGVLITGAKYYPLEKVLKNLGINPSDIERWASWSQAGGKLISVGEGISPLTPYLRKQGVDAYGVDIWYSETVKLPESGLGKELSDYLRENREWLVPGSATRLPYEPESVQVILSHRLVNNFHIADTLDFVGEIVRCLKVGGEARVEGVSPEAQGFIIRFVEQNFPGEAPHFQFNEGLMTYRKNAPVTSSKESRNPYDRNMAYPFGKHLNGPKGEPVF